MRVRLAALVFVALGVACAEKDGKAGPPRAVASAAPAAPSASGPTKPGTGSTVTTMSPVAVATLSLRLDSPPARLLSRTVKVAPSTRVPLKSGGGWIRAVASCPGPRS